MAHTTRRQMLAQSGMGLASLAFASMFSEDEARAAALSVTAPKEPQFPAKAKHVIHLFMNGGPSHLDTFDRKVALEKYAGKELPVHLRTERKTGGAFPSPFKFTRHGESGLEISELFPNVAKSADELCVIRSMRADVPNHEPSLMLMNCGDARLARPSVGSWINYGLGTENQNLPGFIVLCPNGYPIKGPSNWQSAFLPGTYQGTHIDCKHSKVDKLVENIRNPGLGLEDQRHQLDFLSNLNQRHREQRPGEEMLDARIQSFELAYRMQTEASDAFDVNLESDKVRAMYGDTLHGRQMLMARRLVERGVRYVQCWHGAGQPWDSHDEIEKNHRRLAGQCDQAIGALLTDLKQRGLLDETLVVWGGEFGRTPTVELPMPGANAGKINGRDHNHHGFTMWMAGGGVKGGHVHGATDEFGFQAVEKPVHIHDLHATILHLLGFDHEKLTYRFAGRDFRLTDVHGHVVHDVIA
ncbi:hypothetical protein Pan216_36340 [Planctomycetes bacterium Pan216]|uniref:Sulfatase n=1 Tax=Kolteria novifilia TaxID=2527975 RepID=A0A518B708_9BACT|nr:hypothetical protein Pan216_36340 [Planctomycetes bacterium Pan216]